MWADSLDLGAIRPAELIAAIPAMLDRFGRIEFGPDGIAIINGAPMGGLRLVAGQHMTAGATYALVVEERESDGDIDHDAVFLSIEELTSERVAVLTVTPKKHQEPILKSWEVLNPRKSTSVRFTQTQDIEPPQSLDLEIDPMRLDSDGPTPPVTLNVKLAKLQADLSIWMTEPSAIRYEAELAGERTVNVSGFFGFVKVTVFKKIISLFVSAVLRSWNEASCRAYKAEPVELIWQLTIGQLAATPKRHVQELIEEMLTAQQ